MKKAPHQIDNPWYKRKRYLHFDYALKKPKAVGYVTKKENIIKHGFSPLIHYTKALRQYKRDKASKNLRLHRKVRNIFYTSHVDGYIYSYYSYVLGEKYEEYLATKGLSENITAYRAIKYNGKGLSNINFARDAFDSVKSMGHCHVICLDVSSFFDNLCTKVLKSNWAGILSSGISNELPEDHYKVFKSLCDFRYVEEKDIIKEFGERPRKRIFGSNSDEDKDRSLHERICDYSALKKAYKSHAGGKGLIRKKEILKITGIPQGTAISGLLSNIFMMDFDVEANSYAKEYNGFYRRYSDDIFFAFPVNVPFSDVEAKISSLLDSISNEKLSINKKKTEKRIYYKDSNGAGICVDEFGLPSKIQYLGFTFDGEKTHLRNSSMSKNRSKISQIIRKYKGRKNTDTGEHGINTRAVYKAQSSRKITPYDKLKKKGFVSYAKRSEEIHDSKDIDKQIRKNDRFIRETVKKERNKSRRKSSS